MFRNTTSWAVVGMIGWMGLVGTARLTAQEETRLADTYAAWISEVDGKVGGDWSALLSDAKELDESFRERLATLEKEVVPIIPKSDGGVQRAGNRLLRKEDVLLAVESLGDTSVRLQVALAWVDYSLMCERFARSRAKAEASQRNWQEACRVFADYQAQIAARQDAMHELWRLHTGRSRVIVAVGGTGSLQRAATPHETLMFAMQRAQFAMSPIRVEAPHWTRIKDLWSRERLIELTKKQPQLARLQGMVQAELRTLQLVHLEHVQQLSEQGRPEERLMALGSLGWWTDHRGVKMIRDGLQSEPDDPRHTAALSALERLQLSAKDLAPYAKHQQPTVRLAVARLLRHRVGEGTEGLPILQNLSVDAEGSVRCAAFEAAENLFNLGYGTTVFQIRWGVRAIKSGDQDTVLDAIQFLAKRSQGLDPASRVALIQALGPSTRNSDPKIRSAALAALPR